MKKIFDSFKQCGFLNNDNVRLSEEFKNILIEQNEEYLIFIKDQEEPIIEKVPDKWHCFILFGCFNPKKCDLFCKRCLKMLDMKDR